MLSVINGRVKAQKLESGIEFTSQLKLSVT